MGEWSDCLQTRLNFLFALGKRTACTKSHTKPSFPNYFCWQNHSPFTCVYNAHIYRCVNHCLWVSSKDPIVFHVSLFVRKLASLCGCNTQWTNKVWPEFQMPTNLSSYTYTRMNIYRLITKSRLTKFVVFSEYKLSTALNLSVLYLIFAFLWMRFSPKHANSKDYDSAEY